MNADLLPSLRHLARGLSALFWGLPSTLLVCVLMAAAEFPRTLGMLIALIMLVVGSNIARAFALSPKMLLLDEPFGMLDSLTRYELQEVLVDLWQKDQKTALMVTHDVDEALFLSDRVVMMTNGPAATVGEILEDAIPVEAGQELEVAIAEPHMYQATDAVAVLEGGYNHAVLGQNVRAFLEGMN